MITITSYWIRITAISVKIVSGFIFTKVKPMFEKTRTLSAPFVFKWIWIIRNWTFQSHSIATTQKVYYIILILQLHSFMSSLKKWNRQYWISLQYPWKKDYFISIADDESFTFYLRSALIHLIQIRFIWLIV